MAHHGIRLLVNEHLTLSRDGAQLHIAGVNDASYTEKADLAAALNGVPDGSEVILLSHAPAIMRDPLAQRASLVLSGHTHGGQVVLPGIGPIYVPSRLGRRYSSGLFRIGRTQLFITRGLGEVVPPLRINCPPEMAVLTLRAGGEVRPDG
jgi:predicted MPP superfamily phosphohydrolase